MKLIVIEPFDGYPRGHALTGEEASAAASGHPSKVVRVADDAPPPLPQVPHDNGD